MEFRFLNYDMITSVLSIKIIVPSRVLVFAITFAIYCNSFGDACRYIACECGSRELELSLVEIVSSGLSPVTNM